MAKKLEIISRPVVDSDGARLSYWLVVDGKDICTVELTDKKVQDLTNALEAPPENCDGCLQAVLFEPVGSAQVCKVCGSVVRAYSQDPNLQKAVLHIYPSTYREVTADITTRGSDDGEEE